MNIDLAKPNSSEIDRQRSIKSLDTLFIEDHEDERDTKR